MPSATIPLNSHHGKTIGATPHLNQEIQYILPPEFITLRPLSKTDPFIFLHIVQVFQKTFVIVGSILPIDVIVRYGMRIEGIRNIFNPSTDQVHVQIELAKTRTINRTNYFPPNASSCALASN
jgi:hypothetical protein